MGNDPITVVPHLLKQGCVAEAFDILLRAAAAGNGSAALMLGDMRLSGQAIRRDLGEAQRHYAKAAELGEDEAIGPAIALLAAGPGSVKRDWAGALTLLERYAVRAPIHAEQGRLVAAMNIDSQGEALALPKPEVLNATPNMTRFPKLLSHRECAYLVKIGSQKLRPSYVVDPRTGQFVRDPIRTGFAAAFGFVDEDPVVLAINRRIARASGTCWEQGEPMQVIAYEAGEEYKLHSDALPPGQPQRIKTVLVALNDSYGGGATAFPQLGLQLRLGIGDGLMFENVDAVGSPAPQMRHAGLPVTHGKKFILSRWIRGQALDISGPPGRTF